MASILHGNAKTTPRIRKEIQESEESIAALAKKYNINFKTVLYWKHADSVEDKKSGPKTRPSVSTELEQQAICTVRRHLRLSLDELYIIFKPNIPKLSRSNLHRCLQYYGLSRLPKDESDGQKGKKKFKQYPVGFVHIDITEVRCETGKLYLFVAIDRKTKYVYAELHQRMTQKAAVSFLRNLQQDCVFKITHILTDNGVQFTYNLLNKAQRPDKEHPFDELCRHLGIEHRTTKPRHPWTNGQVKITNKMLEEATVKRFHYEHPDELKRHLMMFLLYYNHQRPLRSLKYKTPWQALEDCYHLKPEWFHENLFQKIVGLNT